jgi:hypothetical protein
MRVTPFVLALVVLAGCTGTSRDPADPDTTSGPAPPGGTAEPEPDPSGNNSAEAAWGDPASKPLRPGVVMEYEGIGCSTSFLFEHEGRILMATAAHCVAEGEPCEAGRELPDKTASLHLDGGRTAEATVAYHSWTTMSRVDESDADACAGNDFALLELDPAAVELAHPASLHFQAPTGLATSPTSDIWGFGASSMRGGVQETNPKQGRHLGMAYGGWSHEVYLATPGIFGDSGGHIMTQDGKALGIASTILGVPPAANHYTDIAKALDYMREHEGWAPTIITWPEFHASLVP